MLESIGPLWDGNEVWLVIAGGATFAAFPVWYATMFSGFYLALLLILGFLIVRVLSFEWREKAHGGAWKAFWAWMNTIGSIGAPFLWGVALSSLLHGVPIASDQTFAGDFGDLFSAYSIVAGIAVVPPLRAPRSGLPQPAHARRSSRALPAYGVSARTGGRDRRRGLPRLDAGRGRRRERQGCLPGHLARRGGRDRPLSRRSSSSGRQRALGVRRHGDDDRRGRRHPLRRASTRA